MDEVWLCGAGTVLIVEDKPTCVVFVVGDGVGEKERDKKRGNHKRKDVSHPSSTYKKNA